MHVIEKLLLAERKFTPLFHSLSKIRYEKKNTLRFCSSIRSAVRPKRLVFTCGIDFYIQFIKHSEKVNDKKFSLYSKNSSIIFSGHPSV